MPIQIGTTAAIDSALRRGFSEASVRVAPTTRMTDVISALETMGVTVAVDDGLLVLAQGATEMHTARALRSFAQRPEHEKFFVVEGSHPSQWSTQKKLDFLSTHSADDYAHLCHAPVLDAGVKTLDANMSRADYANLTRQEKLAFIAEFGPQGVERVMGQKSK